MSMIKRVIDTFILSCGSRCDTDSAASTYSHSIHEKECVLFQKPGNKTSHFIGPL